MTDLMIEATSRTPLIQLSGAKGHLHISGESYPEDVQRFYAALNEHLALYFAAKPTHLDAEVKLRHFNSSSARALIDLLDQLDEAAQKDIAISVRWYCDPDDDITREFAEDIAADVSFVSINILDLDVAAE